MGPGREEKLGKARFLSKLVGKSKEAFLAPPLCPSPLPPPAEEKWIATKEGEGEHRRLRKFSESQPIS